MFLLEPLKESRETTDDKHEKEEKKNENRSFHFTSSIEKVKDVSNLNIYFP